MTAEAQDARSRADAYLAEAAAAIEQVRTTCLDDVLAAAQLLIDALRAGRALLICGNGGSAADAQHLATEFVSALTLDHARPAMRALALTTDTSAPCSLRMSPTGGRPRSPSIAAPPRA